LKLFLLVVGEGLEGQRTLMLWPTEVTQARVDNILVLLHQHQNIQALLLTQLVLAVLVEHRLRKATLAVLLVLMAEHLDLVIVILRVGAQVREVRTERVPVHRYLVIKAMLF